MDISFFIRKLIDRQNLSSEEMEEIFAEILSGRIPEIQTAGLLTALATKGETASELFGAVNAMRSRAQKADTSGLETMDIVGTGGDSLNTFNISTTTAFIIAGAGIPIAKHGNRSASSRCGSADVLESCGLQIDMPPEYAEESIRTIGIGFLFAPVYHRIMKNAAPVRRSLGVRTLFNMLGPLINPAGSSKALIGVYRPDLTELFAQTAALLGIKRAMIVHGSDGMDELTLTGPSRISEYTENAIKTYDLYPELYFEEGRCRPDDLKGGDAKENAEILLGILENRIKGSKRNIALLNAGAAIVLSGKAMNIGQGIQIAAESLRSGKAVKKLRDLIAFSQSIPIRERRAG
ncbi:MAG: anthranilate phosphoribosyltransferase [Planctomycetia bacterium]|nr:anthranilate phosphoribosyltransferase [Planctomycetia bacterium]